jgi:hypothetical protein
LLVLIANPVSTIIALVNTGVIAMEVRPILNVRGV